MKKTGIFYGSSTGKTEDVAKRIAARAGIADKDIHNVAETKPSEIAEYDILLLGSSTWGSGEIQEDWYDFLTGIEILDLKDKSIAIFGCVDESMSDTFCNAIGIIYKRMQKTGARFCGAFESADYTFDESEAFIDGRFVGLPLDETNEPEKTDERIRHWVELLESECLN